MDREEPKAINEVAEQHVKEYYEPFSTYKDSVKRYASIYVKDGYLTKVTKSKEISSVIYKGLQELYSKSIKLEEVDLEFIKTLHNVVIETNGVLTFTNYGLNDVTLGKGRKYKP